MQIAAVLESCIEPTGDGHYTYKEGWSDSIVAREIGCTTQLVVAVRKELHGPKFRPKRQSGSRFDEFERRIEQLERDVRFLLSKLTPMSNSAVIDAKQVPRAVPRWDKLDQLLDRGKDAE